jgi:hypothetical protein
VFLLESWLKMLSHPTYQAAQGLPWYDRPIHMVSDQDALTAMMGSADFASTPVVLLERGTEIAQCFGPAGFTPAERLRSLLAGPPALVHAQGKKPWSKAPKPPGRRTSGDSLLSYLRQYYDYLHLDFSTYTIVARRYRGSLGEDTTWIDRGSLFGRLSDLLFPGSLAIQGLPLALFDATTRHLRRIFGIMRYKIDPQFTLDRSPLDTPSDHRPTGDIRERSTAP